MNGKSKDKSVSIGTRLVYGKSLSSAWNFDNHVILPIIANTTYRLESVERSVKGFADFADFSKEEPPIWIDDRLDEPNNLMLEEQRITPLKVVCKDIISDLRTAMKETLNL